MGIEPTFEAWEAPVLPLNYTRDRWPPPSGASITSWPVVVKIVVGYEWPKFNAPVNDNRLEFSYKLWRGFGCVPR